MVRGHGRGVGTGIDQDQCLSFCKRRHGDIGIPDIQRFVDIADDGHIPAISGQPKGRHRMKGQAVNGGFNGEVETGIDPNKGRLPSFFPRC